MRPLRFMLATLVLVVGKFCLISAHRLLRIDDDPILAPPTMRPAERVLLASIVGMAICATWIAMTWRAWG